MPAGLAEMLADQGVAEATGLAGSIQEAVTRGLARSVAPPPRTQGGDRVRHATGSADHRPTAPPPAPEPPEPLTDPATAPQPHTAPVPAAAGPAADGPINYAHPRRQHAAPPSPPPTAPPAQPGQAAQPVAGDATGWSMDERLYNQIWGMFEDLARAVAAYRSAVDFAESRMDQELDRALSDPRNRIGGAGDRAREAARAKRDELTSRAREALDRDLAQLAAEAAVVEPALPAAYAGFGATPSGTPTASPWRYRWPCASATSTFPSAPTCACRCSSGCRWSAGSGWTADGRRPRRPP